MASQEVDNAELGTASAGAPGSQGEPEVVNNSVYRPIHKSQNYQEELQALGTIQILNGAIILALGAFMSILQNLPLVSTHFFLIVSTGYPLWGGIAFIVSGVLSVIAGKKPTKEWIERSFGMNIASTTIALVGLVFLSMNLAVNNPSLKNCQSFQPPDLCIYKEASSNGLVSIMLILTLLELCTASSISVKWCKANCSPLRKVNPQKQIITTWSSKGSDRKHEPWEAPGKHV
ncbi:membrane-spanning 4-domains subfamily A member 3 [Camelus ferus]|uniref:Membrane-spanning 4-domains subfamily A member 3 n=1 Tax=Camelus ferus TaxID=419612 RepID=A0A8B8TWV5_CAMFR|nr:membrane-spanning 4-domains subfamily A member 3 [Camelus ferus]